MTMEEVRVALLQPGLPSGSLAIANKDGQGENTLAIQNIHQCLVNPNSSKLSSFNVHHL